MNKTQAQFVDFWGRMAAQWGAPEDAGRVLAFLYLHEDPYNVAELSEALALPKARVKKALEPLLDWESIEAVEVEGMRGDYYLCALEAYEVVWRLVHRRGQLALADGIASLEVVVAQARKDGTPAYERGRLAEALRWCRFIDRALEDMHKLPSLHLQGVAQITGRVAGLLGLK